MKEVEAHRAFVDGVTSTATKELDTFISRIEEFQTGDPDWSEPQRLLTGAIGICSEGGELLDLVKKILFQGKEPTPEIREKIKLELGDVMWYVQQVLISMDWSLEEVLAENTKKLSGRYPEGFSTEKSENREE
jgi:NTP pyrophosphatase (non-canonical NTP hydrolase)|tara:strand:- start:484 stop:882 length:399 start_codon:yes stop_codon:yes gene_type:complete